MIGPILRGHVSPVEIQKHAANGWTADIQQQLQKWSSPAAMVGAPIRNVGTHALIWDYVLLRELCWLQNEALNIHQLSSIQNPVVICGGDDEPLMWVAKFPAWVFAQIPSGTIWRIIDVVFASMTFTISDRDAETKPLLPLHDDWDQYI